jgi:hypothetical protein
LFSSVGVNRCNGNALKNSLAFFESAQAPGTMGTSPMPQTSMLDMNLAMRARKKKDSHNMGMFSLSIFFP